MPMYATQLVSHGGDRLQMAPPPPHRWPPRPQGLYLSTFNICDVRGYGLTQAIWAAKIGGFDLIILI